MGGNVMAKEEDLRSISMSLLKKDFGDKAENQGLSPHAGSGERSITSKD